MKKSIADFIEFSYEKLKLLKRSERGEVWLANTRANNELVIIKHVNSTGLPYDVIKNSSFRLPAKVFFCAEDDKDTVVVEEFIRGESMLAWLEQKRFFSEDLARQVIYQLCDGLKELHAQNIIHRDIKPSNLIFQSGIIRLIDFDAARIFKSGKEEDTKFLGTRGYAPPEQYGSGQTDPRSDIYSLGVTIKNLLGAGYDGRLKNILDKCTEYDPARRFQSVSELKRAVRLEKFSFWGRFFAAIFFAGKIIFTINHVSDDVKNPPAAQEKISAEVSIGGLKLGDSIETAQKIFGKAKLIHPSDDYPGSNFHEYKDLVITVKNDLITGIATCSDAVEDFRGIRQGDGLEKVIVAYGAEAWQIEDTDGTIFYEYPLDSARGILVVMRFAIKNNVVEYISLRLDKS